MGSQRVGYNLVTKGLPWWLSGKESTCQCKTCGFDPWVGNMPWRRKWQSILIFLPGKSRGQRSLKGYSPAHGVARVRQDFATEQQQVPKLWFSKSGAGPAMHTCTKFPGGADAAGLGNALWEPRVSVQVLASPGSWGLLVQGQPHPSHRLLLLPLFLKVSEYFWWPCLDLWGNSHTHTHTHTHTHSGMHMLIPNLIFLSDESTDTWIDRWIDKWMVWRMNRLMDKRQTDAWIRIFKCRQFLKGNMGTINRSCHSW